MFLFTALLWFARERGIEIGRLCLPAEFAHAETLSANLHAEFELAETLSADLHTHVDTHTLECVCVWKSDFLEQ